MSQDIITGDPHSVLATISRPELVNLLLVESRERAKGRLQEIQATQGALLDRYEVLVRETYAAWVRSIEARVNIKVKLPKGYSWGAWLNVPSAQEVIIEKTRSKAGLAVGHVWHNYRGDLFAQGIKGIDLKKSKKASVTSGEGWDPIPSCFLPVYFNDALLSPEDSKGRQCGGQGHRGVLKERRSYPLPESMILWREVKVAVEEDSRVAAIMFHMPIPIKMDLMIPEDTLKALKGLMDQVYSLRAEADKLYELCQEQSTPAQERVLLAALTRSALVAEGVSLDFNKLLPPLLTTSEPPIK